MFSNVVTIKMLCGNSKRLCDKWCSSHKIKSPQMKMAQTYPQINLLYHVIITDDVPVPHHTKDKRFFFYKKALQEKADENPCCQ